MAEARLLYGGLRFMGVEGKNGGPYPAWRYHKFWEPVIVNNTDEDLKYQKDGYQPPEVPLTAIPHLSNWCHDLEDFNARQLVLFAKEEYGADLPEEAGEERLIKAIWRLAREAPQNEGRIVLLAQTIKMNYDATLEEIRRRVDNDENIEKEQWEFEA